MSTKSFFIRLSPLKEGEGSAESQIFRLTNRVAVLTYHFQTHGRDYSSQRGLWKILGRRKRLLAYLSRSMEKIAENRTVVQYLPYVTRWDYLATMFTEAVTVNASEKLTNIQVPRRASYIRIIMLELSRIASHLLWLGPFMADIGAQTPFFYIFREREMIYDLFEAATGMRMMHNYFRVGGVAADLPYGWIDKCLDFCDYFLPKVVEYENLITNNPIFLERVEGVGVINRDEAINWGLSGPML